MVGVELAMGHISGKSTTWARKKHQPLGRNVWLEAARQTLIRDGAAGVQVNKLAKQLSVSRGGFYWFFKSREHLLRELLAYWDQTSTVLFEGILQANGPNGMGEIRALIDLWIDENEYHPKWDAAIRDWARTSQAVLKVVRRVDQKRLTVLKQVFLDLGYVGKDAQIRARVMYYHQVGYYALGVRESRKQRRDLIPYYTKVLTGRDP